MFLSTLKREDRYRTFHQEQTAAKSVEMSSLWKGP